MKKESQRGLTSVQISILMSIISIILCIALPIYLKISQETKYALCKENVKKIREALDKFYKKDGRLTYPTEPEYKDFEKLGDIGKLPTCPVTKTPYKYEPIWDSGHQNVIDYVLYCDSPNAHSFIDKKGYPRCNAKGLIEPEKDKSKDKENSIKQNYSDEEQNKK